MSEEDDPDVAPEIVGGPADQIDVRALLRQHGLWAKKGLGQCFLRDKAVLRAISAAAVRDARVVIEIGAGLGALTSALLDQGASVIAVERDRSLVPLLRQIFRERAVVIVEGDATELDLGALSDTPRPALVGNLPYSVTTPLLLAFLRQRAALGPATLMIQREVADRLLADPGSKAYGSLTVLFQLHAEIERLIEVRPESFWPEPKVRSTVIRLRWRDRPAVAVADLNFLEQVVRSAFSQRRKTLRNSLSTRFQRPAIERAGAQLGLSLDRRAETLTLKEFADLAAALGLDSTAEL